MANRKQRNQQAEERAKTSEAQSNTPLESSRNELGRGASPEAAPPGTKPRKPFGMMMVMWGLHLLLFIVIAVIKECP